MPAKNGSWKVTGGSLILYASVTRECFLKTGNFSILLKLAVSIINLSLPPPLDINGYAPRKRNQQETDSNALRRVPRTHTNMIIFGGAFRALRTAEFQSPRVCAGCGEWEQWCQSGTVSLILSRVTLDSDDKDNLKIQVSRPFQQVIHTATSRGCLHKQPHIVCSSSTSRAICLDISHFPGLQEAPHLRL